MVKPCTRRLDCHFQVCDFTTWLRRYSAYISNVTTGGGGCKRLTALGLTGMHNFRINRILIIRTYRHVKLSQIIVYPETQTAVKVVVLGHVTAFLF